MAACAAGGCGGNDASLTGAHAAGSLGGGATTQPWVGAQLLSGCLWRLVRCGGGCWGGDDSGLAPAGGGGEETANSQERDRGGLGHCGGELVELAGAGECAAARLQHVVQQYTGCIPRVPSERVKLVKVWKEAEIVGWWRPGGEGRGTGRVEGDGTGHGQTVGGGLAEADAVVEDAGVLAHRRTIREEAAVFQTFQIRGEMTGEAGEIVGQLGETQLQLGEGRGARWVI